MSARPYHVVWNWKAETERELTSNECCTIFGDCEPTWGFNVDAFLASVRNAVIAGSYDAVDQLREQGVDFAITMIEPQILWVTRSKYRQFRDYSCRRDYATLKIGCVIEFESNVPVSDLEPIIELSPALVWWQFIFLVVVGAILTYLLGKELIDFARSLLTKESKIDVDFAGHCNADVRAWMIEQELPPCTVCEHVEFSYEKKIREPDWMSMLILGGVAIVGLGVILPPTIQAIVGRRP